MDAHLDCAFKPACFSTPQTACFSIDQRACATSICSRARTHACALSLFALFLSLSLSLSVAVMSLFLSNSCPFIQRPAFKETYFLAKEPRLLSKRSCRFVHHTHTHTHTPLLKKWGAESGGRFLVGKYSRKLYH